MVALILIETSQVQQAGKSMWWVREYLPSHVVTRPLGYCPWSWTRHITFPYTWLSKYVVGKLWEAFHASMKYCTRKARLRDDIWHSFILWNKIMATLAPPPFTILLIPRLVVHNLEDVRLLHHLSGANVPYLLCTGRWHWPGGAIWSWCGLVSFSRFWRRLIIYQFKPPLGHGTNCSWYGQLCVTKFRRSSNLLLL